MRIHLIDPEFQDIEVWRGEASGKYIIKSGYQTFMEAKWQGEGGVGSSDPSLTARLWKKVWKLNLCPRVRDFVWRCCMNILPCEFNLAKPKYVADPCCEWCGCVEMQLHVLSECPKVCQVWDLASNVDGLGRMCLMYRDWFEAAHDKLGKSMSLNGL